MRGWGVPPSPLAMPLMFMLLLLFTTCVNAWSFSSIVDSFNGRFSPGVQSSRITSASLGYSAQNIQTSEADITGPRDEATIITAPRRRRTYLCKSGQKMDRRGKCRTTW